MGSAYGGNPPGLRGNHYGSPNVGVLGSAIRAATSSGANGSGFLFPGLTAADDAKEIRGTIIAGPTSGQVTSDELGAYTWTGLTSGVQWFTFAVYDGNTLVGTNTVRVFVGTTPAATASVPVRANLFGEVIIPAGANVGVTLDGKLRISS